MIGIAALMDWFATVKPAAPKVPQAGDPALTVRTEPSARTTSKT
jgi:hypothetical protein